LPLYTLARSTMEDEGERFAGDAPDANIMLGRAAQSDRL
jgi:hypothetical protein